MDIVIFGSGEVGKRAVQLLNKDYHILFLVDNNEKKWESTVEEYRIKSPEEIRKNECDVVIASARYGIEIADQLDRMGIDRERIWFFRSFGVDGIHGYDIYPLEEELVNNTAVPLVQYRIQCSDQHKRICTKSCIGEAEAYLLFSDNGRSEDDSGTASSI